MNFAFIICLAALKERENVFCFHKLIQTLLSSQVDSEIGSTVPTFAANHFSVKHLHSWKTAKAPTCLFLFLIVTISATFCAEWLCGMRHIERCAEVGLAVHSVSYASLFFLLGLVKGKRDAFLTESVDSPLRGPCCPICGSRFHWQAWYEGQAI